ncbi:Lrp/AsnC family transcriptional regulator [Sphingomonas sp. DG1-23]|uniref:Lrp/AsnC family transcriptional regulator n=1 Tax=Sphingomonas sp. DG1-23 TaxID=3068316 RepID=UPI00273F1545|nr:Lrp/AsnC family transcriptional regulator [Sphingomonas sp. DG1-23]MDP5280369.1 Lrp/AsnC family transcriptional regulator [Sphingomonas sp. DG1-23]
MARFRIFARALDAFDRAILRIVQHDNKTPQRQIAEAVNLSAAAVQRRIAAMEEAGIIARNVAVIDPDALSLAITAIVEVHLRDERASTVDMVKAVFRDAPEVQQAYYVTGGVSFVLVILSRDMREYEALTRRLFEENDAVDRYRTLIALDRVKAETALVIPQS